MYPATHLRNQAYIKSEYRYPLALCDAEHRPRICNEVAEGAINTAILLLARNFYPTIFRLSVVLRRHGFSRKKRVVFAVRNIGGVGARDLNKFSGYSAELVENRSNNFLIARDPPSINMGYASYRRYLRSMKLYGT